MRTMLFSLLALTLNIGSFVPSAAAQALDPEWAQQFVGTWDVTLQTPDGAVPIVLSVKEEAHKVTVQLGRGEQQGRPIADVRRSGDSLVARYDTEYQGMSLPTTLSLKRAGDELSTEWDFGGMYATNHRATKR